MLYQRSCWARTRRNITRCFGEPSFMKSNHKERVSETRKRLSLYDQAEAAERKLLDAQAVETATRTFWEQAQADVSRAQVELDTARDKLFAHNDRRAAAPEKKK